MMFQGPNARQRFPARTIRQNQIERDGRKPLAAAIVRLSIAERLLAEFASEWPKLCFEDLSRKGIRNGDM